jgi:hypothetical protein
MDRSLFTGSKSGMYITMNDIYKKKNSNAASLTPKRVAPLSCGRKNHFKVMDQLQTHIPSAP